MSPEQKIWLEGNKLLHATLTQLVTISSGSILILLALKEKLFPNPRWKILLAVSFACFLGCVIFGLVMMRNISLHVVADPNKLPTHDLRDYEKAKRFFISAVIALVIFMIGNLY
jgi:hypothetical protein